MENKITYRSIKLSVINQNILSYWSPIMGVTVIVSVMAIFFFPDHFNFSSEEGLSLGMISILGLIAFVMVPLPLVVVLVSWFNISLHEKYIDQEIQNKLLLITRMEESEDTHKKFLESFSERNKDMFRDQLTSQEHGLQISKEEAIEKVKKIIDSINAKKKKLQDKHKEGLIEDVLFADVIARMDSNIAEIEEAILDFIDGTKKTKKDFHQRMSDIEELFCVDNSGTLEERARVFKEKRDQIKEEVGHFESLKRRI